MPQTPTRTALVVAERALLGVVLTVALLTILGVASGGSRFLPMNDAPSHIANAVIAHKLLAGDAFFASHYRFDLVPVPYWATALLMLLLQKLFVPLIAWRIITGSYLVLLPLSLLVSWPATDFSRLRRTTGAE